jgi:hypothetical protein
MKRIIVVLIFSLCVASAVAQTPVKRSKPSTDAAVNDQALAALTRMANFLKTLKTFSITAESSRDEIVDKNMKIQKNATSTVNIQLPDRLQARVQGDDHDLQFVYDGQTMSLFTPNQKYYATGPAPDTVSKTLDDIRVRRGIVLPLADIVQMATGENLLQDITEAGYIGTSRIDGTDCDHIAVRQPEVDWQVWIERGQTPLPRRLVITSKKQPTQPQYTSTLVWNLSPHFDANLFKFTPPSDAVRIKFARTNNDGRER